MDHGYGYEEEGQLTDCMNRVRQKALEEAALVVERWSLPTIQAPSMWLIDKAGIAAAIRALADE